MKAFHFGAWTVQIYWPRYHKLKGGFNVTFLTAITLSKSTFGFEVLGFGIGVGYFSEEKK